MTKLSRYLGLLPMVVLGCADPVGLSNQGAAVITVRTLGGAQDSDGYRITIRTKQWVVRVQDTLRLNGLPAGPASIVLGNLAPNCFPSQTNPTVITIEPGKTSRAELTVSCPGSTGSLRVLINTLGIEPDTDGYVVHIDGVAPVSVGTVDTVAYSALPPGVHALQVENMKGNCDVVGPAEVQIAVDQEITARLDVHCGWLLVQTCCDPGFALQRVTADGQQRILVSRQVPYVDGAVFSPDGKKIAFNAYVGSLDSGSFEIFVMNRDGSGLLQLTQSPGVDWAPAWSPDGSKIVFVSIRAGDVFPVVHVMNADGSNVQALTLEAANETSPIWSPDGGTIFYVAIVNGNYDIWRMDPDGTNRHQLTPAVYHYDHPELSPDGSQIVFASHRGTNYELYLMSSAGVGEQQLTDFPGATNSWPRWSPGGGYIGFSRLYDWEHREGYLMKRDGSQVTQLNLPQPWVHIMDWQPR